MPSCALIYRSYLSHLSCYSHTPAFVFYFCCDSSVQLLSHVQLFATPWTAARQAFLNPRLLSPKQLYSCPSLEFYCRALKDS